MRVLVTGAAGFIGQHLIPALQANGDQVVALDTREPLYRVPDSVDKLDCDITKVDEAIEAIGKSGAEAVVHLAAMAAPWIAQKMPQITWTVNVQGTYNVLQGLRTAGIKKVVFMSSAHVYGISPKYMPTDESHPLALLDTYCYDDQTEVLTDSGWKRFVDLSGTEKVMQLNAKTGKAELVKPSLYYKKPFKGSMYLYEGKSNFCVTPEHRFWYQPSGAKWTEPWRLTPIEDFLHADRIRCDSVVRWEGQKRTFFELPDLVMWRGKGRKYTNGTVSRGYRVEAPTKRMSMVPWLKFLGWYIAEGSCTGGRYVRLTQKASKHCREISGVLRDLGFKVIVGKTGVNRDCISFTICSKQLVEWLGSNCYDQGAKQSSYTKRAPRFIAELTPDLIRSFVSAYWRGDGHRIVDGGGTATTYSAGLSSDLHELVLKSGKVAGVGIGYDKHIKKPYWRIHERKRNTLELRPGKKVRVIQYDGMVACVEVPSHIVMTRRNGKSMWCGNTTTKVMGEKLCELFYSNYGIAHTTLRLFNGYGPGQSPDYFLGAKLAQAKIGPMTLRNAKVTKDWVFVTDIVDAIARAVHTSYVGPLNIGTGVETSLETIARMIAEAYGRTLTIEDVSDGPTRMCADIRRAKAVLGWEPKVSFMDGLKKLL